MPLFTLAIEAVSQCENHMNVILSRRRRISRFPPPTKTRSFGYRLRMTLQHRPIWGEGRVRVHDPSMEERDGNAKEQDDLPELRR